MNWEKIAELKVIYVQPPTGSNSVIASRKADPYDYVVSVNERRRHLSTAPLEHGATQRGSGEAVESPARFVRSRHRQDGSARSHDRREQAPQARSRWRNPPPDKAHRAGRQGAIGDENQGSGIAGHDSPGRPASIAGTRTANIGALAVRSVAIGKCMAG